MPLHAENLAYRYGRRPALAGVSLSVGPGVTALLGPNGAGKTTLLKCLVGLLEPHAGFVEIDSVEVTGRRTRIQAQSRVGYVPQNPQIPELVRVQDVVGYAAWLSGVPSSDLSGRVEAALVTLELEGLRRRRVRTLSGGQRQRVALATGLVHDPAVLVLDEPTAGLDPGQRLTLRRALQKIGRKRAVLVSTHLTEDVQHLAGNVVVLVDGRVCFAGRQDELISASHALEMVDGPGSPFERGYEALVASFGSKNE